MIGGCNRAGPQAIPTHERRRVAIGSIEAECDRQRVVEMSLLDSVESSPSSHQHGLRQREDIVAVGRTVMVQSLLAAQRKLRNVMVERAGDEDTDERRQDGNGGVPTDDDDDRMLADAWDIGGPDVAPPNQRRSSARHAATEKAAREAVRT